MNSKAKGTRAEHRSIKLLEAAVTAAAALPPASGSGTSSAYCRKLVHRWRDRQRLPDVKEL
jgi:hypothetical protein